MDLNFWALLLAVVALACLGYGHAFATRALFIVSAISATIAAVLLLVSAVT